ncbi:MAG: SCO family protein [Vicinamibacterales bacterium]|nr:SCO family protein [Vicinamibacterales bacterium]
MRCLIACLLLPVLTLAACAPAAAPPREYELAGQVLAVRAESNEILIRHGDIKDFMPGMTMPFRVRDQALLGGVAPGDLVTATLVVGDEASYLSAITRTGSAPLPEDATGFPAGTGVHILQPGDEVPDTALSDQEGDEVRLPDWRGQAVAVTFIFTRCPLPEFCPLMDKRFAEIQQGAAADRALAGRVRLLSVSFDPDFDTPEVLKAHAGRLGADPAVWRFATAPVDIVDRFAAEFGVNVIRETDGGITHTLRTAVIGPDGRMVSVYSGNLWTAAEILDDLRSTRPGTTR